MTGGAPKLALTGLSKRFESVEAVRDLSLALAAGEFVSLLGPSGCGKSTTMAMVAGFEEPDAGEIAIDGAVVNRVPPQRRRIGLVFQDYAVFTKLKVRDNLSFGLEARRVRRAARRRAVAEMADKLGLDHALDRRAATLNMSEMQRVALGRVLITNPELLLLDEPMSNLDASIRVALRSELKRIQKELGQTVLYVTHDQVEAMSMSDRIAVMNAGELLQVGTPEEIYRHPVDRFVTEFIGDPPVNVMACAVRLDGGAVVAETAGHSGMVLGAGQVAAGDHWLALRPHDIKVMEAPGPDASPAVIRLVENFGSERVLHVEYGDALLRVVVPARFEAADDATVHLTFDTAEALLIDRASDRVVPLEHPGAAR